MVKRIISVLALAGILLSATGCQMIKDKTTDYKGLVQEALARQYTFDAEMTYGDTLAAGQVEKTGASDLKITFTAPPTLEGLVVAAEGDQIYAQYLGIELDLSVYDIPTQSVLTLLREILTVPQPDNISVEVGETTVTASGSMLLASYEIVFDKETMAVLAINVPTAGAEVAVSNFVFTD